MKVSDFLKHHGININPFSEEDAQSDSVFQNGCAQTAYHPGWDKIFGDPSLPATSIVFGEKGAGKTALKLQMIGELEKFNKANPDKKDFIIQYDNFNPFLDTFQEHVHAPRSWISFLGLKPKPESVLKNWTLWDHIDSILTLGVTKLVNQALQIRDADGNVAPELNLKALDNDQKRDFLLLAGLYDQTSIGGQYNRWSNLRHKLLGFYNIDAWKWFALAVTVFLIVSMLSIGAWHYGFVAVKSLLLLLLFGFLICIGIPCAWRYLFVWSKARNLQNRLRIRSFDQASMRQILSAIPASQLIGQPLLDKVVSDDRYSLLETFSNLTKLLGYKSIVILIDRVDEPHLINGSASLMKDLIWSILDNKLLKFPNIAFKMLLPEELYDFARKENKEFKERSRLDKQNLIESLCWTGASLYDLINARIAACTDKTMVDVPETLDKWFDDNMTINHLTDSLERVKTPRRTFRFLYDLLREHVTSFTDQNPQWTISTYTFDSVLKAFLKD